MKFFWDYYSLMFWVEKCMKSQRHEKLWLFKVEKLHFQISHAWNVLIRIKLYSSKEIEYFDQTNNLFIFSAANLIFTKKSVNI